MSRALLIVALLLADVTPRGDYFRPETARHVTSIQIGTSWVTSFSFTRDARRLIVLKADGKSVLWDLATRREIREMPAGFLDSRLSVSADASRALGVAADRRSLRLMDVERAQEVRSFSDFQSGMTQLYALSPDGRRVAYVRRDRSVRIWDAATGDEKKTLIEPATNQCGAMAWSPDGKLLAIHGWDSTVRIFDPGSGEMAGSFAEMGRAPLFLGYSPDSSTLVLVTQEARIRLFDRTGREIRTLDETLTGPRHIAFSPDGQIAAGADVFGKVRLWDAKTWRRIRDLDSGSVRHLAFSPDGRYLALGMVDGSVKLWGGSGPLTPPPRADAPRGGEPGFLGITGDTEEDEQPGVLLMSVIEGTAAAKAGLRAGDRILKIGTSTTDTFEALRTTVTSMRAGDETEIIYSRDGVEKKVKLTLGARPADE